MVASSTFYQLNYSNQADLLLQEGTFIQSRFEDKFIVDLYELHDLMVEVFYHRETEELVSVMACNTKDKLKTITRGNIKPRLFIKSTKDSHLQLNESFAA